MNTLRKQLLGNKEFNPFHSDFNSSIVQSEAMLIMKNATKYSLEDVKLAVTLLSSLSINAFSKAGYEYIKSLFFRSGLDNDQLLKFIIVHVNRSFLISTERLREHAIKTAGKNGEFDLINFFNAKVESAGTKEGETEINNAVESDIDNLHIAINYLRYFKNVFSRNSSLGDLISIDSIQQIYVSCGLLNILKGEYEGAIWNEGFVFPKDGGKNLEVEYPSDKSLLLRRAGQIRLHAAVTSFNVFTKKYLSKELDNIQKNKNIIEGIKIDSVNCENGILSYTFINESDSNELLHEIYLTNQFTTFYPFLEKYNLPKYPELDIADCISMFGLVQYLFYYIEPNIVSSTEIMTVEDFNRFPIGIKYTTLFKYLRDKTKYSSKQITSFLSLLTNDGDKRTNFWETPFLRNGEILLFPILTIQSPIVTALVDYWLEVGGTDLKSRGKAFELYIKEELANSLQKKGYTYHIPKQTKFYDIKNGKFEEIDLVINLKNIIIIAEIKCITYPFEPRNIHNALKTLKKATEQVKRKSQFLSQGDFNDDLGISQSKPIVSLVITNYPFFTGEIFDEVPIIDAFLIESYFNSGVYEKLKVNHSDPKHKSEIISSVVHYETEDEFNSNFKDYILDPPPVKDAIDKLKVVETKVFGGDQNFGIYTKYVTIK